MDNPVSILAQQSVPPDLINWLAKLKTLQGVPFNYLVCDERLLPPESIKFFQVDASWLNALLDGALSIGRHHSAAEGPTPALLPEMVHGSSIPGNTHKEVAQIRKRQFVGAAEILDSPGATQTGEHLSGFLLRSSAVSAWKSMDVVGYPKGKSPYDYEQQRIRTSEDIKALELIRLERLSPTVMFGLFSGDLYELVLHQPAEAIHFGFALLDIANNQVSKNLRVPSSNWDDPDTIYDTSSHKNIPLSAAFADTDKRVLDMTALSQALAQQLAKINMAPGYYSASPDADQKSSLVSSDFALEMVQGVGLVSFINDSKQA